MKSGFSTIEFNDSKPKSSTHALEKCFENQDFITHALEKCFIRNPDFLFCPLVVGARHHCGEQKSRTFGPRVKSV